MTQVCVIAIERKENKKIISVPLSIRHEREREREIRVVRGQRGLE